MPEHTMIGYVRFSENAIVPVKATTGSSAVDLFSAENVLVPAQGKSLISTDIGIVLPDNTCGVIMSRSGLALNEDITVFPGLIDNDYRGAIKIIVFNDGHGNFEIRQGMRIAQLLIQRVVNPYLCEVSKCVMAPSQRGSGGFGSTGS